MGIIYTRPNTGETGYPEPFDGGVSIIRGDVDLPIYASEYAINPRYIPENMIPTADQREFRDAWSDVTPGQGIDIDCSKAKDIQLKRLRAVRGNKLLETDKQLTRAWESEDGEMISALRAYRTALRDVTEPLKRLNTTGKVNCLATLQEIRNLGVL